MKKMKKLLSLMLAVVMVASTVPYAFAEEASSKSVEEQEVGIITNQAELDTALKTGGSYKLGNDIIIKDSAVSDGNSSSPESFATIIDMDGHTIKTDSVYCIYVYRSDLTILGGKIDKLYLHAGTTDAGGVGKITVKETDISLTSNALGCHGGELILQDATVNATHGSVIYSTAGTVYIKGGTYSAASDAEMFRAYEGTELDVRVYGGTFNKDVSEFVAENCEQTQKDGSYVVDSSIKGTAGEGVNWHINYKGTLTISGTGKMVTEWYSPPWEEYNELITSVVVEEGITEISGSAFCYAINLKTAFIPSTVSVIGSAVFDGCESLEEIKVHDDNVNYKSIDGVVFSEDEKILIIYPSNKAGNEYDIPDSVTTIYDDAFRKVKNLDSLSIPDTVKSIGNGAFSYSKIDSIVLGNGITKISKQCFEGSAVKSIVISDSVEEIKYAAFWCCQKLETLIIGSGVKVIARDILYSTSMLSTIHYKGTQETWDNITIDSDNSEDNGLRTKTLHFIPETSYLDKVDPTCKDGHTAGYYCNDCEAYITGEVIPAVDEHIDGEPVDENVVGVSCTTPGTKDVVTYCTVCSEETSRETVTTGDMLGHKIGDDDKCTVCGNACEHRDENKDYKCDFCNGEIEIKTVVMDKDYSVLIDDNEYDEYVKFVPEKTGTYVIESDNGGNDDDIDPYVDIYDSNNNRVASNDDSNYFDTYNFCCIFRAEKGKEYFIELGCYDYEVEYEYRISANQSIEHQPTSGEPWLEMAWDYDAEYQWYAVEMEEITDENAEGRNADGEEIASYSSEEGWKGVKYSDTINEMNFFMIELEAGDTINMQISEFVTEFGIWSVNNNELYFYDVEANEICQFTASGDDIYYVYAYCSEEARVRAYFVEEMEAIEGENEATLKNPTMGTSYVCIATDKTGTYISNVLTYTYAIIKQPTESDLSVGLNGDADAKYQWYYVDVKSQEITDEDADIVGYGEEDSYYDEDGWHASLLQLYSGDYMGGVFFGIDLEEGQKITFEFDAHVSEFGMLDWNIYQEAKKENFDGGKFTLVAPASGHYEVYYYGEEDFALRAYMEMEEYIPIDGATSATYNPDKVGNYVCKVTFSNGTTEMSKVFEVTHAHTGGTKTCKGYKCDGCGEWYGEADANAHSFTKYEVKKAAKCGEKGLEVAVCDHGCGKQNEKEIAALTHIDKNSDSKCDNGCGYEFKAPADNNSSNGGNSGNSGNNGGKVPGAGDNSNIWLWFAILFVSGMGAAGFAINQKKRMVSER